MADFITDDFDQLVGVGDIIIFGTTSNSSAKLTRAEVVEITKAREKITRGKWSFWSDYKMKVRPEGGRKLSHLTRAPFVKVANAIDFDEYVASLRIRYGLKEEEANV